MSLHSFSKSLSVAVVALVFGGCAHMSASTDPVYISKFDEMIQCAKGSDSKLRATEVCIPKYAAAEITGRVTSVEPAFGKIKVAMDEYKTPAGTTGSKHLTCYFDSARYKEQLLTFTPLQTLVSVRGSLSAITTSHYIDFITFENCEILSVGATAWPPKEKTQRADPRKKG